MIRGGCSRGRIAQLFACAALALALVVPTTAGAQSAVDEYQLDIPGGGGSDSGGDPNAAPPTDASASASGDTGATDPTSGAAGSGSGDGANAKGDESAQQGAKKDDQNVNLGQLHDGRANQSLDTSSRSAPEVVADTLLDSAMLPILAVLVLITGLGAWRVLRSRRTLSGQAG
jgi:hypothetical protein